MANLYERELYQVGNGGLAIYIPKPWARFWGLKPGDRVVIIADDGIFIKPKGDGDTPKKIPAK